MIYFFFIINIKTQNHLNNTLLIKKKKKTLTLNLTTFIIKIQPINIFISHLLFFATLSSLKLNDKKLNKINLRTKLFNCKT